MKLCIFITLASFVALGQSGVIMEPQDTEVVPYSIVDSIIKMVLESMKPKLANIKLDNINETIREPNLNATILVKDILIKNADQFDIVRLKSKVAPLQLANLTLAWKNISASAAYDIDANLSISEKMPSIRIFAKGDAKAILNNILFTIGANLELKNNALQIKPKGLFGFDLIVEKTNITLTSILGNADFGKSISVLLSQIVPQLIETLKKPVFDTYQDQIITIVNQILKKNGTAFMDEEPISLEEPLLQTLDLSFWKDSFEESEENNFELNF